ncbi:MAG TPA: D-aminoacylase [Blastocatellia bacterium]|nr:D-aminoacylase [Blastocatellia bacterium]
MMTRIIFRLTRLALLISFIAAAISPNASACAQTRAKSFVIVGGTIIDGSGRAASRANVRVMGDRIVKVGNFKLRPGEEVIDARGLTVAPGFIDIHNHSESGLATEPTAASQISQGITTLAVGPDGGSPFPIADYLAARERQHLAVNVLAFVGHATVRQRVMGDDYKRAATEKECGEMARLVEQAMREGAFGLSTGLEYDVGHSATTEEVIALSRVAARFGGIYMSHIRDEADEAMSAFDEAIRIGREAHIPVQISHIKLGTVGVWGKAKEVVSMIEAARRSGIDVTADCYPYDAWASTITVLIPSRRHDDPIAVKRGLDDVGGAANVLVTSCKAHPEFEGKTLEEIAGEKSISPVDAYIQIVRDGGAGVVCRSMIEPDIKTFYQQSWVMVASDGGIGSRHPRGAGTFPKVLGCYAREQHWLTLEDAVRKMTSMPAKRLGLTDRGLVRKGMKADLVIFDAGRVTDRSTFKEPQLLSVGIERVFVNGEPVWEQGKATGRLPGAVIRKVKSE